MTDDELAAVRARWDASAFTVVRIRGLEQHDPLGLHRAFDDVAALLAEVDRLRAENERYRDAVCAAIAKGVRRRASEGGGA